MYESNIIVIIIYIFYISSIFFLFNSLMSILLIYTNKYCTWSQFIILIEKLAIDNCTK